MLKGLKAAFQRGQQTFKGFNFGGYGGTNYSSDPWGGFIRNLSGANYDYRREAGLPWENSAVMSCVNWAIRTFPEAPLVCERKQGTDWEVQPNHPAVTLLNRPNDCYTSGYLWAGLLMSWMMDGNSYWFVERSVLGEPQQLFYMPHFQVTPRWPANGSTFISDYLYKAGDKNTSLKPETVLHFRNGVDLQNSRRGMSPLTPVLREICADNEASTAAAALMRNLGIPGLIFHPQPDISYTQAQLEKMADLSREKMTGDRRGETLVMPVPMQIDSFGFSPEQMALDKIRRVPEERICGVLGIHPIVVGLGAGLDRSTFANFGEANRAAYNSFLVPAWRALAEQLSQQFLPMFNEDTDAVRLRFDTSNVQALIEDEASKSRRVGDLWTKGCIKRYEVRTLLGYHYQDEAERARDDCYYQDVSSTPASAPEVTGEGSGGPRAIGSSSSGSTSTTT